MARSPVSIQLLAAVGPDFLSGHLPQRASSSSLGSHLSYLAHLLEDPRSLPVPFLVEAPRLLLGPEDVTARLDELRRADILVVGHAAGESQVCLASLGAVGRPVILVGEPGVSLHFLAGAFSSLRAGGVPVHLALDREAALEAIRTEAGAASLRKESVLLVGGVGASIVDGERDPARFSRLTGIPVTAIPWGEVLGSAESVDAEALEREVAAWWSGAQETENVDVREVEANARVAVALESLASGRGVTSVAFDCTEGIVRGHISPCLAASRLEDAGYVAGCEGDLTALLARLYLRAVSGQPGFLGNLGRIDLDSDQVTIWHNTAPLTLRWREMAPLAYRLRPYGQRAADTGVQVVIAFEAGAPATLLRLSRDGRSGTVVEGTVLAGGTLGELDRSKATLQIASARRFLDVLAGNHQAMAYGHWADQLGRLAGRLGIQLERV